MKRTSTSLLLLLFTVFLFGFQNNAKANRAAAADIAYKWVSDSTYLITYTFYKDCGGATAEPSTVNVCYYNTCNLDRGNITLNKKTPLGSNGQEVQAGCSAGSLSTTCSAVPGTLRGYRKWVYEGTVILPSRCDSWHFAVSIGFRNGAITNYTVPGSNNNLYVEATLNNVDAPGSSSPTFTTAPIQYMCNGTKQSYFYNGVDADGDVLSYSLIDPASAADNQVTCSYPATPTSYVFAGGALGGTSLTNNPFATGTSFNLDGTNGTMTFTPTAVQTPQLALLVTKKRGAKVVGSVIRDMQFVVSNGCTPSGIAFLIDFPASTAALSAGVITPGPAGAPTTGAYVCPNVSHTIKYNLNAAAGTTINVTGDNHLTFSPTSATSTNTIVGNGTNVINGTFDWTPNETDQGQKYLVIRSTVCTPGNPTQNRLDTIPIFTGITVDITATDTMICLGEISNLCADETGYTGITIDWSTTVPGSGMPSGSLGITTPTLPCTDVYSSSTATYLVTTNHPGYCNRVEPGKTALTINQDEIKIVVANPKIDVGPDTVMCSYSQLQLNANLLNPQPELTYEYTWTPGHYLDNPSSAQPILKFSDTSTVPDSIVFYLKVVTHPDTTCFKLDTVVVHILKGFYILTGDQPGEITGLGYDKRQKGISDTAICTGQSVALVGWGDPRYNYVWTPSTGVSTPTDFKTGMTLTPTTTTTYSLTASRNGCKDSTKQVVITVEPFPVVDVGPDRTICFGDTIHMLGTITPSPDVFPGYKYQWTPGGALERADTFFTYFTGYRSEVVKLTVTTPAGCVGEDAAVYLVQPRAFLTKSNDTVICPGDKIGISVTGDNFLKTVTWKPANTLDSIHKLNPTVSPYYTTNYTVVGLDSNNCVDSTSVLVTVLPRAVLYLPDTLSIYPGDSVQLEPTGNGIYYTWFPGSGLSNTKIANPYAKPSINTTYKVTTVTDMGCKMQDSVYIMVSPDSEIDMPNAFTPGRGNENSTYKVAHLGKATLTSLTLFNRWGEKVFETTNIDNGWDGNLNGTPQPMGVYVYVLKAKTFKGQEFTKSGNFTLIR